MWQTWAEAHAAVNDLPPVLFVASVLFDLAGTWTRHESLKAAGFWTVLLGAVGAVGAVATGLMAEDTIDHGESIHEAMGPHKTWAITVTVLFGVLALWRLWRRGALGGKEWAAYLVLAAFGAAIVTRVAHLGGNMTFRMGAGVPTAVMQQQIKERAEGHHHHGEEGDAHADHDDEDHGAAAVDSGGPAAHTDSASGRVSRPGTPPQHGQ